MLSSKQNASKKSAYASKELPKKKKPEKDEEKNEDKNKMKSALKTTPKSTTQPKPTSRQKIPVTPPSRRVTKTQYFPSKSMYSNALQQKVAVTPKEKPKTEPPKKQKPAISKPQQPTIKEFIKKMKEEKTKADTERPGTATLTEPRVLKIGKSEEEPESVDYEEDFDSYESDFEAYSSQSSSGTDVADGAATASGSSSSSCTEPPKSLERKLDSGTFEMTEQKHKQMLVDIKEMKEKENVGGLIAASLTDEGFEEVKSLGTDNLCFVDFGEARKRMKRDRNERNRRKRGEELMNMIKLDNYSFTLLDLAPMPYERYIKLYGHKGCIQASSQTGEHVVSEETQTDDVSKETKWTQVPTVFSKIDTSRPDYLKTYKSEHLGVGSDGNNCELEDANFNEERLERFLRSTAEILTNLLQENNTHLLKEMQNSELSTFSSGYVECNTQTVEQLKGTVVAYIACDCSHFLTLHKRTVDIEDGGFNNYLCAWSVSDLNRPERIMASYCQLSCGCFCHSDRKLIFGGSEDGTIVMWDGKQNKQNAFEVPHFVTEIATGHIGKVISIQSMHYYNESSEFGNVTTQICTLDENGTIIFWSIITKHSNTLLVLSNRITLGTDIHCTDLLINKLDQNHLFVSTSLGFVVHTTLTTIHPKVFSTNTTSGITCLAGCPFSELYFLAGFRNGNVALYSRTSEKPLIIMINKNSESGIQNIEWSRCKPCVFYVKHEDDVMDTWDLTVSDMSPVHSFAFEENVTCVKLMPTKGRGRTVEKSFMLAAFGNGQLQLHLLNRNYNQNSSEDLNRDIKKFLSYVNRL